MSETSHEGHVGMYTAKMLSEVNLHYGCCQSLWKGEKCILFKQEITEIKLQAQWIICSVSNFSVAVALLWLN